MTLINTTEQSEEAITGDTAGAISAQPAHDEGSTVVHHAAGLDPMSLARRFRTSGDSVGTTRAVEVPVDGAGCVSFARANFA